MSALGAIAFLIVFMALVCWACVAVGTRHDAPEPTEPRPIRPSVDHYDLNMEAGTLKRKAVKTRGDWIRSMCDEDLAAFFSTLISCERCPTGGECDIQRVCDWNLLRWLKEEVSE